MKTANHICTKQQEIKFFLPSEYLLTIFKAVFTFKYLKINSCPNKNDFNDDNTLVCSIPVS